MQWFVRATRGQNDAAPEPPGQDDSAQPARGNHDGGVIARIEHSNPGAADC
jgi:hypothetical protein